MGNLIPKQDSELKFIRSTNVKVFPCAYRGYDNTTDGSPREVFDPESAAFTEYNFTNLYSKVKSKESFIISWEDYVPEGTSVQTSLLKCVIGGYYFELKDLTKSDFLIDGVLYKLVINTSQVDLGNRYNDKTWTLKSLHVDTATYLDTAINGIYCFTGIALVPADSTEDYSYSLYPCLKVEDSENQTYHIEINWSAKRLDDILAPDTGHSSVKMLGETIDEYSGACEATGDYAVALGEATKATAKHTLALIANSEATAEDAVAIGNKAKSKHKGSFALGKEVQTGGDNQVIIGYKTTAASNDAFVIGNNGKKFVVNKNGDVQLTGNILATSNNTNHLELGNIEQSIGSITVYGLLKDYIKIPNEEAYTNYNPNITYYKKSGENFEIDNTVTLANYSEKKSTLYIKKGKILELDDDGDLTVNGNVDFKETLHVVKDVEADANITGHGDLVLAKKTTSKTHTLTLGSDNPNDYGKLDIWGQKNDNRTKVFEVGTNGATTIQGKITGNSDLEINGAGSFTGAVSITNNTGSTNTTTGALKVTGGVGIGEKLNVAKKATINDGLEVNKSGVSLTVDNEAINYNNTFIVAVDGATTAKSLALDNCTIDAAGKITGKSFDVRSVTIDNDGFVGVTNNISLFKSEISGTNPKRYQEITIKKNSYTIADTSTSEGQFVHNNALVIDNTYEEDTSLASGQASGLHINGKLTAAGDVAIFSGDRGDAKHIAAKISQEGTAYFNQGLAVGGVVTGENDDTVTFRVGVLQRESSFADLKGNLHIITYDTNKGGDLTVDGETQLDGNLTVGNAGGGVKIEKSTGNITTTEGKITAKQFNATSDIRKKTNIKDYSCKKSILDLPIKEFEFINDENHIKHIGCIAQDLQEICPEIVHEGVDGYLSIEETKLVYLLLQEVKELKKEIKALKGE